MDNWGQIITGILALIAAGMGTWATFKRGKQSDKLTATVSKETNAIAFSEDLLKEVRDLRKDLAEVEKQVRTLRTDLDAVTESFKTAINFTEYLMLWALGGCVGPMPRMPYSLRKHFDPALVEEHERQQASPKK